MIMNINIVDIMLKQNMNMLVSKIIYVTYKI